MVQSNGQSNGQSNTKYQVHCSTGYVLGGGITREILTVAGKHVNGNFTGLDQSDYAKLCNNPGYKVVYIDPITGEEYLIYLNIVTRRRNVAIAGFNTDNMTMTMLTLLEIDLCKRLHYTIDHSFMDTVGITYHCIVTQ